jgi:CRISPR/Cas system CSM-associated protein Csm2 small subunit
MATINEMRRYIMDAYPNSSKFRAKVVDMPTNQVIAVYHSILDRQARKEKKENKKEEFHQLDIWEYMVDRNEKEKGLGTHTDIK